MISATWPVLLGVLLTLITAWSLGKALVRSLGVKLCRLEEDLMAFLAGSACLSAVVFALCCLHMARRGVFVILCLAAVGFLYWRNWLRPAHDRLPRAPGAWWWLFLAPFAVYTFVYFFNALAPQTNPGATGYHLGNVMRWWAERGFDGAFDSRGSAFANLPQGLEMLFLFAFPFGKYSAAVLVHFAFLVTLPWLMLCYGRRFGLVRPSILGAILIYASPAAGALGTSASNAVAMAAVLFGLFYMLELWDATGDHRLLALIGLLAGFGYAINYAAALAVLASMAFVIWRLVLQRKPVGRAVTVLVSTAAISILPWMIKNWIWVSNPFAPFLNRWFPNPNFHVSSENSYAVTLGLSSAMDGWKTLPWLWSLGGTRVESIFGPWLLLTPLALLAVRWKHGRRLLLAAGLFGLPALVGKAFTLVLPFAVFSAYALGIAVQNTPGVLPLLLILHSLVSWPKAVAAYAEQNTWRIEGIRIARAVRSIPEEAQLLRVEGYAMVREIERLVPRNAKILTLSPLPQAYTTRRLWDRGESAAGELAFEAMSAGYRAGVQRLGDIDFRFAAQSLRAIRAIQTVRADGAWSVIEMRVYLGGREVERGSSWRVSARPNAWDAPRAFDNSEVTAWSTWQPIEPGMYLEEQFDAPVTVDEVVLVGPYDKWVEKLRIDGVSDEGRSGDRPWRTVAGQPVIAAHLSPPGLRRAAIEELRFAGFDYIVAKVDSRLEWDLVRYPSYWGVSLIEEAGKFCVFRLDR